MAQSMMRNIIDSTQTF